MYLKSLTALGFKSFAEKTTLNFLPGITAIVGPNGCGKSNVADSLRWALGEQSAKALRGSEMADVIFNGTDGRKALGMAEVSLTIGDVDQEHLKAAGVELAYNEVTLTRRVFRDGVSEYFINKTPCRLKDIQQLFMGTGVGRSSYSIMAQGHITQLLSSRPEDRRLVFEEAAGITRFKSQKKEALRKLEVTDQNLLRVSDLIREVKRQIGSLQRQAGKARRYKQYMLELQHLDTQLARHQFDVLQAEIHERQTAAEKLRVEMEACSESVLREEDQLAQLRANATELEHSLHQTQQQSLELKGQVDHHESRIQFNHERLQELEQQNAKALGEISQDEERRLAAEQELAAVVQRLTEATTALEQSRQALQGRREALQKVENELRSQQETLRQAQSESFGLAQQLTRVRNEITALDLQKQGNAARLEKLSAEKIQLEEERVRLEARLNEFTSNVEAEKQNVVVRRGTLEEQQNRLRELQQELAQVSRDLDELLRQQAAGRSRLNVLEQLQAAHEGFSVGALAALKQSPQMLGALVDRIRVPERYLAALEAALGHHLQLVLTEQPETAQQVLADLKANHQGRASIASLALLPRNGSAVKPHEAIQTLPDSAVRPISPDPAPATVSTPSQQPQAAVSDVSAPPSAPAPEVSQPASVTGQAEPNLSVNSPGTPLSAELPEGKSATATAVSVPAEQSCSVSAPASSPASAPAMAAAAPIAQIAEPAMAPKATVEVVSALEVIESDECVRPLLKRLLGHTLIAPELATATSVWRERSGDFDLVTISGEVLSRHGVYSGGSLNGADKSAASILGRKNQIAELQSQLALLQDRVNDTSRRKGSSQSEQTELQASLQQQQSELRSQEVAIATHQGECKALENALGLLEQKVETVMYEIESLAAQEQESLQKRQGLAGQVAELAGRDQALQQRLSECNGRLEALRLERDAANNGLTETKVALATQEQLTASFQQQQRSHEQRIRDLAQAVEQRRGEIASLIERRSQFQREMQESRLKIDALQHERDQVNLRAAELAGQKSSLENDLAAQDESLRSQRQRLAELQQQRGALEVELAQKDMAVQNLRDRIQQKYQLNLDQIRSECITITIADEGPAKVQTLTPEEMASRGLATDWNAVADQIAALQRRIDEIGPVNLVAIEEYEETEQRYQFLSTQHDDLVKAKEQLLEVINRINTQTTEMFAETFAKVRENFAALFTEIFGGGKADLQLVNEGDLLESGIDILARPPGKQLKSITLLSGGEQTMTAVALLFAIYQVKPSPFCVLDELDAPLDESNINRFIGVLKRFLQNSQFIIITHNKRTIGMADVIYGVTMQEHGVSKIVSMRFRKATGTLTDHPPGLTAPEPAPFRSPITELLEAGTAPGATSLPTAIQQPPSGAESPAPPNPSGPLGDHIAAAGNVAAGEPAPELTALRLDTDTQRAPSTEETLEYVSAK